jgi:glycosyltransferase involved in cell wall biosynthesis
MSKLISVIVPCYNVENYIDRCINSILNQTIGLENIELILVNDASPDSTLERLYYYEDLYPDDIIVINSEQNLKQGGARNLGLYYASADYIGFVDSDDWIEPTMYEKLYNKAISYDCDIVTCNYKRVANEGTLMGRTGREDRLLEVNSDNIRKDILLAGIGSGVCKVYRNEFVKSNNILFPEHLSYEDNYFIYLLTMYVTRIYFLEEYLYHYFINVNSTVVSKNASHHFDRLTIELLKVDTLKSRGLFDKYYFETEYNFLMLYYFNTLHIFFTRFDNIPADILKVMQIKVKDTFPTYKDNPYLDTYLPNVYKSLLKTIELPMNLSDWKNIAYYYRKTQISSK